MKNTKSCTTWKRKIGINWNFGNTLFCLYLMIHAIKWWFFKCDTSCPLNRQDFVFERGWGGVGRFNFKGPVLILFFHIWKKYFTNGLHGLPLKLLPGCRRVRNGLCVRYTLEINSIFSSRVVDSKVLRMAIQFWHFFLLIRGQNGKCTNVRNFRRFLFGMSLDVPVFKVPRLSCLSCLYKWL